MIIPVRCMSCGHVLADKWEYYSRECQKLAEETSEDQPTTMKNMDKLSRGKILDDLGLKRLCCRRHMLGNQDMMDII